MTAAENTDMETLLKRVHALEDQTRATANAVASAYILLSRQIAFSHQGAGPIEEERQNLDTMFKYLTEYFRSRGLME